MKYEFEKPFEMWDGDTIQFTFGKTTYKIVPTFVIEAKCKVREAAYIESSKDLPALPEGEEGDE